jgi:hypothetical protein
MRVHEGTGRKATYNKFVERNSFGIHCPRLPYREVSHNRERNGSDLPLYR